MAEVGGRKHESLQMKCCKLYARVPRCSAQPSTCAGKNRGASLVGGVPLPVPALRWQAGEWASHLAAGPCGPLG